MIASQLPAIVDEMLDAPRWLLWRYEGRNGKQSKVPYQTSGYRASSINPTHWTTFEDAAEAFDSGGFSGVGFSLSGAGMVGIDLDDCIVNGSILAWAQEIIDNVPGYAEISPSGRGVKIFTHGTWSHTCRAGAPDGGHIEVYSRGRYFCVTGKAIQAGRHATSDGLDWLCGKYFDR